MTEFLEIDGQPIPGFSGKNGYRMFGDDTALKTLFWHNGSATSDLSSLKGRPVRIRFTLREVKLYAMQFLEVSTENL